jgi:hypothetical protein
LRFFRCQPPPRALVNRRQPVWRWCGGGAPATDDDGSGFRVVGTGRRRRRRHVVVVTAFEPDAARAHSQHVSRHTFAERVCCDVASIIRAFRFHEEEEEEKIKIKFLPEIECRGKTS